VKWFWGSAVATRGYERAGSKSRLQKASGPNDCDFPNEFLLETMNALGLITVVDVDT
jgi:hypothetical protein